VYHCDPLWSSYTGTGGQAPVVPAAAPWGSSDQAACAHVSGPWSAALPLRTAAGAVVQPAAGALPSTGQGKAAAAAASQPLLVDSAAPQPAAAQAPVVETLTQWSYCSENYIVEWQFDDGGWWANYDRSFSDRLEECYQSDSATKEFKCKPGRTVEFVYNVKEFWQMNTETQGRRLIRRILTWTAEYLELGEHRAAVVKHNQAHHNMETCHARTGRRNRSQSAAPNHPRSRSKY
jgi:WWE domain